MKNNNSKVNNKIKKIPLYRITEKSPFFHNFSLNPLLSLRFPIMKKIIGIMNFIILILNTLKIKHLAIMENYGKLWKIIICSFVGIFRGVNIESFKRTMNELEKFIAL